MQELFGNLTVDQFCKVFGCCTVFCCVAVSTVEISAHFLCSLIDGKFFYKTKEYYASLRYIQKYFRTLKNCGTVLTLDYVNRELNCVLDLLVYQGVLPKFLYRRLCEKSNYIYNERRVVLSEYWNT